MDHPLCRFFVALGLAMLLGGCGETYCQYGPKYGMQCHDINAQEHQETQVRGETVSERYMAGASHPRGGRAPAAAAPGCAVFRNDAGLLVQSAACWSERQPAHGAVR